MKSFSLFKTKKKTQKKRERVYSKHIESFRKIRRKQKFVLRERGYSSDNNAASYDSLVAAASSYEIKTNRRNTGR